MFGGDGPFGKTPHGKTPIFSTSRQKSKQAFPDKPHTYMNSVVTNEGLGSTPSILFIFLFHQYYVVVFVTSPNWLLTH